MTEEPERQIDLHESEWSKAGKREPVLGINGVYFLLMVPTSFAIYYVVSWLVIDLLGFPTGR